MVGSGRKGTESVKDSKQPSNNQGRSNKTSSKNAKLEVTRVRLHPRILAVFIKQ